MQGCRRVQALLRPARFLNRNGPLWPSAGSAQIPPLLNCTSKNVHYMHGGDRGMLGTTVLCVRKDDKVIVIGDGQVTLGSEIIKPNVRKVRRIGETVIGGFAGATADSFTLFERLENKLEEHPGKTSLTRAAVELAKAWRSDKYLRRLDAVMVVADSEISLTITGNGDVLEPYDGVIGIGSGGSYASAAARALIDLPNMDAETIALKSMKIAADCCIYTNHNFTIERLTSTTARSLEVDRDATKLSNPDLEATVGTALKEST
ncbi:hypothetical protein Mp_6g16250 [Marchantia polymorpha subsp. ruderalis]|uniref:HslU--HslV peptidase n=2 Tax=Marchantia polymorpha TaxID=3197 RepID=A0AAF6BSM5_MARPO|nr:hypothetical protein MARPO_0056s0135 [Marchantia polymorpha]BBN15009.1 hypothetical protein Mp_6g16250 [Marchantia polymorpha subsp. ruderalis]|eukprot:PTQ37693.1 hypothetical protein MARPO_0056s0135 [Marchantia polymorpha]